MDSPRQFGLCLRCAEIIPPGRTPVNCPACKQPIDWARLEHLRYFGRNAFEYGCQYRECYEKDYRATGKLATRCQLLSFSEFMTFAAIAAASGVIGNVAYDVIKAVLLRLWHQAQRADEPREYLYPQWFKTEAGRQRLLKWIKDYADGFAQLRNHQVRDAIKEEIVIDLEVNQRHGTDPAKYPEHLRAPPKAELTDLWGEAVSVRRLRKRQKPRGGRRRWQ